MLRVSTISAKAGMKLAMPVFHPEAPERVLLRTGFELDSRTIVRLRELRVRVLWISYPKLQFLLKYASPEVIRHRASVAGQVHEMFDLLSTNSKADLEYSTYSRTISSLSNSLTENPASIVLLDDVAAVGKEELEHACSVSFIAVLMGLKLSSYMENQRARVSSTTARNVTPLGVAGMLHDIGMRQLPEDVLARFKETRDTSDPEWQLHTEYGYRVVHGRIPPSAAAAVMHHHQAFDGSGFPIRQRADGSMQMLRGEDIHIYARVIAAADMFDRKSRRLDSQGNPVPRVRVLKSMLSAEYARKLDPMVLKGLLAVCPPYPPGSMLKLSDGKECVVVGWKTANPCRPTVMVLEPSLPDTAEPGEIIDLCESTGLCVAEINGQNVGRDNFYPMHTTEYCLESASKLLHNAAEVQRQRSIDEKTNRRSA